MKKKIILSSILTIALCLSLIAGSTFALFTSESSVNVAVTSGKVKVTATAGDITYASTLGGKLAESSAAKNGNIITIDKMVPGDKITFDITIHNESDVTVNYRTKFSKTEGDNDLFGALKITVAQNTVATQSLASGDDGETPTIVTPSGTMQPNCDDIVLHVTIELPETAGNELQGKSCKFAYTVEAVQGNAEFDNTAVSTVADLREAIANGGTVKLANDITFTDDDLRTTSQGNAYMLRIEEDITIDLNGKKLQYTAGNSCPYVFFVTRPTPNDERGATLTITDSSADKSGSIYSNSSADNSQTHIVYSTGESTVNIYGGNFKAIKGSIIYKNNGYINIYGGKFETEVADASLLNCGDGYIASHGPITVSGGSFKNFQPGVNNPGEVKVATGYHVDQDGDWYNVVPDSN